MYEGYPDKEVYDGEVIIYLNTRGIDADGVSDELVAMLTYFEETTNEVASSSGYERIARLHEIVTSIKASDEIGVKYMNAKALKDKGVDIDIIAETSGLSVENIMKL